MPEDMYCAEQICIPPTFPYLLRQYAKAAIRTQPTDLLRWSSAYFRCLSLNVPPPVKQRLEYPIPRDHNGITPGWLKALIYQLQNNPTVSFKILWDRWMGACLQHNTLIQILCLGEFDNPQTIPCLKFIALCAGHLTDDLTHTMILICELLTEEPEGGSAMITLENFVDLYKFLAKINASKDQMLKNHYFRDSLLSLWKERVSKEEEAEEVPEEVVVEEAKETTTTSTIGSDLTIQKEDVGEAVSCPSLPEDDHYSLDYLLEVQPEGESEEGGLGAERDGELSKLDEEEEIKVQEMESEEGEKADKDEGARESSEEEGKKSSEEAIGDQKSGKDEGSSEAHSEEEGPKDEQATEHPEEKSKPADSDVADEAGDEGDKPYESAGTITDETVRDLDNIFEDEQTLREDLERLKALQQEMAGETDDELEKFKCQLIAEMPLSKSQEDAIDKFEARKREESEEEKLRVIHADKYADASSESQVEEKDKDYDEVFVPTIPGIGAIVPDELVQAVGDYMKGMAKIQHGMVMPRNVRHYSCPPLEILEY